MIDAAAYVSERQGRPYTSAEHCWWLVQETQRTLFQRELPTILISDEVTTLTLIRAFHNHPERERWVATTRPVHGAIVLMHRPGSAARAIHAGTYLDLDGGGIFHTDEDHGVTFDGMLEMNLRNWRCEFYHPRNPCNS